MVLVRRLQTVMEEFGMYSQTGFRPDRGTTDGLFTTSIGLHKRKEHGLETWELFIDLVKAFDTVPREALFAILRRFGLPDHFASILICLHQNALINVKIGEDDSEVESSIGVRQGSCEGPILFLFIMQAAMEILTWPITKPVFRTRYKGFIMSERSFRIRDASSFGLWTSLFSDNCAIIFNSRADLELGASYFFNHLRHFGLMMHIGFDTTLSKTEAMYFPPVRVDDSTADTPSLDIRNADGPTLDSLLLRKSSSISARSSIIDSSLTSVGRRRQYADKISNISIRCAQKCPH
jgi:hypothetical protein